MRERYMISGENRLRMFEAGSNREMLSTEIAGAGALCAGGGRVFCAGEDESIIWVLDADMLTPRALFVSGPQVGDLHLSPDGERLYVLCSGADSVLMLHAKDGEPQILARAGVNPPRMALSSRGDILAVAGGASERVILLDAQSLAHIADIPMPGPVQDVAVGRLIHALCCSERMESLLVSDDGRGNRYVRAFGGLPGALLLGSGEAYAAACARICRFDPDAPHRPGRVLHAPGRAGRMIALGGQLIYTDVYTHEAFALEPAGNSVRRICAGAGEIAAL